jgi:hypothetical protein
MISSLKQVFHCFDNTNIDKKNNINIWFTSLKQVFHCFDQNDENDCFRCTRTLSVTTLTMNMRWNGVGALLSNTCSTMNLGSRASYSIKWDKNRFDNCDTDWYYAHIYIYMYARDQRMSKTYGDIEAQKIRDQRMSKTYGDIEAQKI